MFNSGKRVSWTAYTGTTSCALTGTLIEKAATPKLWWVKVDGSSQSYYPSPVLCEESQMTLITEPKKQ